MNRIVENEEKFIVYIGNKTIRYSKNRYGKFAKLLALKTFKDGRRYENYFITYRNYTIFYISTKAYGIKTMLVDNANVHYFFDKKISIAKDKHAKTFYAKTKDGAVHREIMNFPNKLIDHINHNGLDNRQINLRMVNTSANSRNATIRVDSPLKIKGVTKEITKEGILKYISTYRDSEGKRIKHTFSSNKYGEKQAFLMAVNDRLEAESNFGYIRQECSETIEQLLKEIDSKNCS